MIKSTGFIRKAIIVGYVALSVLIISAIFFFFANNDEPLRANLVWFLTFLGLFPLITVLACLPLMIRFGGYKLSVALLLFVGFWLLVIGYDVPGSGGLSAVTTVPASLLYIISGLVMFSAGYKESKKLI